MNIKELRSGIRRRFVSEARRIIACRLVKDHGIPLSEVARYVGVSTSAVSNMIDSEVIQFNKLRMSHNSILRTGNFNCP